MNNYTNLRVQAMNQSKMMNRIKHNIRAIKSRSEISSQENIYIDLSDGDYNFYTQKSIKGNSEDSKGIYKNIKRRYDQDRIEHTQLYQDYRKDKRKLKDSKSTYAEFVFTFSESIHKDLGNKYTQDELISCAVDLCKDLEETFGFKPKDLFLHLDEATPHFHFFSSNYDDKGLSITHRYRDRDSLSSMQDMIHKHFKKLGMERGVKKSPELCGVYDYQTVEKYHTNILRELKQDITKFNKDIKDMRYIKKNLISEYGHKSKEVKEFDNIMKDQRETIKQHKNTIKRLESQLDQKYDEMEKDKMQDLEKSFERSLKEFQKYKEAGSKMFSKYKPTVIKLKRYEDLGSVEDLERYKNRYKNLQIENEDLKKDIQNLESKLNEYEKDNSYNIDM